MSSPVHDVHEALVLVPLLAVSLAVMLRRLHSGGRFSWPRAVAGAAACCYGVAVVKEVLQPFQIGIDWRYYPGWRAFVHLTPLIGAEPVDVLENVLLFAPLGVFLALLARVRSAPRATLIGFMLSLAIETTQLVLDVTVSTGRVADVNDLLGNTTGAAAGYTQLVTLRTNAPIRTAPPDGRRTWLHHGSSISQGSNATVPTGTWPAVAAVLAQVELVNLGFGGGALLDPFTARTIRDTPADLISLKIGINIVNADLMRLRAFGPAVHGFLDTIREGHPAAPVLVASPIYCPINENTPGPCAPDASAMSEGRLRFIATGDPAQTAAGKLTLTVIRDELTRIVRQRAATDPHLHYLDGLDLYGKNDHAERPLPDNLHPDPATHQHIGERFAHFAFGDGGPFTMEHR